MSIPAGTIVPLQLQLPDINSSQYVLATVTDPNNNPVAGSPFALSYTSLGNYSSTALVMPDVAWIKAIYEVFTDSGHTILSTLYGISFDIFYLDGFTQSPRLIGLIGGSNDPQWPSSACSDPFTIDQGADVVFNVLLNNQDTGLPFDISQASSISAQFQNTDGTFLTLSLTSGLSILTPCVLGQIQVTLTAAQTALLQYGRVSMQVTVVISGHTTIVPFPYALNILQSVFS